MLRPDGLDRLPARHVARGVLVGGALFLVTMLVAAAGAVAVGAILPSSAGRPVDLRPWLMLEVVGGTVASALSGWVCRKVSHAVSGPILLAGLVLTLGLLEAAEVTRYVGGRAGGPSPWLILGAPFLAAGGVLLGGAVWRVDPIHPRGTASGWWSASGWRAAAPVLVCALATALALFVLPGRFPPSQQQILAFALHADLVVVMPGLVFLLLVRGGGVSWLAVLPAAALGQGLAGASLPTTEHLLSSAVRYLVVPAELALIALAASKLRSPRAPSRSPNEDGVTVVRRGLEELLGNRRVAGILATEWAILRYAAFRGRPAPAGSAAFSVHRKTGIAGVVAVLATVVVLEAAAVHLLVLQWSTTAAWVLLALNAWAVVWCLGDLRALAWRPMLLTDTHLLFRVGLRWEACIPLEAIERIEAVPPRDLSTAGGLCATVWGRPTVRMLLRRSVEFTGLYGARKVTDEVWFQVDDLLDFVSSCQTAARPQSTLQGRGCVDAAPS